MILQIKTERSKYLRKKTKPIHFTEKKKQSVEQLISDMKETLANTNGVGLAAPQVGRKERLFIVSYGDFEQVFINPQIIASWGGEDVDIESCLSVPNRSITVTRPNEIGILYYDKNMEHHTGDFKGVLARIIQHEYDHLEGKLITDYL